VSNFLESLRAAITAIFAHKLRSFLTTLGIIIGVMSVIAVVSLLQGFSFALSANFRGMGSNTVFVTSYLTRKDQLAGKTAKITTDDLLAIQHEVPGISRITPVLIMAFLSGKVQYQGQTTYSVIAGTTYTHAINTEFYPVEGRYLTPSDDFAHRRVAVVGASVVRDLNLGEHPEGRFIQMYNQWFEVIGVVAHQRRASLARPGREALFLTDAYFGQGAVARWAVRATGDPAQLGPAIRSEIARLDPRLVVSEMQPMQVFVDHAQGQTRFALLLIGIFACIAALLAAVGLYGVLSAAVRQRTAEIGVRMALGAAPAAIFRLMVGQGLRLSAFGIGAGLIAGLGLTRVMESMLVGVQPSDPLTFAVMALLFFVIAAVSSWLPARRAALLDPTRALRDE